MISATSLSYSLVTSCFTRTSLSEDGSGLLSMFVTSNTFPATYKCSFIYEAVIWLRGYIGNDSYSPTEPGELLQPWLQQQHYRYITIIIIIIIIIIIATQKLMDKHFASTKNIWKKLSLSLIIIYNCNNPSNCQLPLVTASWSRCSNAASSTDAITRSNLFLATTASLTVEWAELLLSVSSCRSLLHTAIIPCHNS